MKKLKVVFFGTPEFAVATLDAIYQSHHELVGIVTVADKASGRGQKISESPVKKYAVAHNIPVFQPIKLRDPQFLNEMKLLDADIFVVVAFRMMPKILFSIPTFGTFNLHASLLPNYRGAAPINYAVINGEAYSGVTTFFINEKIDEGNILLQEKVDIQQDDDAGTLHDKLMQVGADLVVKTLNGLADGTLKEHPQLVEGQPKPAPKIYKEDLQIDWQQNTTTIYNFIRGMSPYPGAFTQLEIGGKVKTFKIFKGTFELREHHHPIGTITADSHQLLIYTRDGVYFPLEVQLEGKKRMSIKDFLNGLQHLEDLHLKF